MRAPPVCTSPRDLVAALQGVDPARLTTARAALAARPIEYALGSGEADEVALYAGIKPLVRQVLSPAELPAARARFWQLGLSCGEATHRVALPSTGGVVLFVSRDPRRVQEAVRCEALPEHDLELGRLLGYPRCCVEAYLEVPPPRTNVQAFAAAAANTPGRFLPRLNTIDLAVFHYLSWVPCSFGCELSRAFADAVAHHLGKRHGQFLAHPAQPARASCPPGCRHERFVEAVDAALGAHRLLVFEDVQVSLSGRFDGEVLQVERAWPTARDRHPDARLEDAAGEASARVAALVGAGTRLRIEGGAVSVDGATVFSTADARLFPFGEVGPALTRNPT